MAAVGQRNYIGGIDPDQAIYRTYSMKWFLELLSTGKDALRNPSAWEDPFENFFLARTKVDMGRGEIASNYPRPCAGRISLIPS